MQKWGIEEPSSNSGEFDEPMGLTIDNKNIYICDYNNNRVQILSKEHGIFVTEWKEFIHPVSIYCLDDEDFFIGDDYNVHVLKWDGSCRQKIGDSIGKFKNPFDWVYGISFFKHNLVISERRNQRIQIFRFRRDKLNETMD